MVMYRFYPAEGEGEEVADVTFFGHAFGLEDDGVEAADVHVMC